MSFRSRIHRVRGFSLLELIAVIVIVGLSAAAILGLVARSTAGSVDPMLQTQALYVAEAYLEEIMLKAYAGDGVSDCGAPRHLWDEIGDYGACLGAPTAVSDPQGGTLPGLAPYRVAVSVGAPQTLGGATVRRIRVRVTHTEQPVDLSLTAYRAGY